MRKEDPQTLKF